MVFLLPQKISTMKCCGRNKDLKRCKNKLPVPWYYPFCPFHKIQPLIFVGISLVGFFANWTAIYDKVFPDQSNEIQTSLLEGKLAAVELALESISEEGLEKKLETETGFSIKELNDALPRLKQIAESDYENGNLEYFDKNYEVAIEHYSNALLLNPNLKKALNKRGCCYSMLELYSKGIQDLDAAIAIDSNYKNSWYNKGVALARMNQKEKAISCYDRVISIDSLYISAYINKGTCYGVLKNYEDAKTCFEKAIAISPEKNPKLYNNLGHTFSLMGNTTEAMKNFDMAISIDNKYYSAYSNKIFILGQENKHQKIIELSDTIISLGIKNSRLYSNKAYALRQVGKHKEALNSYDIAISIDSLRPSLHYSKGITLLEIDSAAQALQSFHVVKDINAEYKKIDSLISIAENILK